MSERESRERERESREQRERERSILSKREWKKRSLLLSDFSS